MPGEREVVLPARNQIQAGAPTRTKWSVRPCRGVHQLDVSKGKESLMPLTLEGILEDKFALRPPLVENLIQFYDEKATIPFVARYRKDQTGNMDEVKVAEVYDAIKYFNDLFARKAYVLEEIEKKGKLTDELRRKIEECLDAKQLEGLYLPYKEKKKTKAEKAREAGLEPLARILLAVSNEGDPQKRAEEFLNAEKGYGTVEKALEGALYIVAQQVLETVFLMEEFIKSAFSDGVLHSAKKRGYSGDDTRFEDYYEYSELISQLRVPRNSHRYLAIMRGVNQNALSVKFELDDGRHLHSLMTHFIRKEHFYREYLEKAVTLAYEHYLRPALETRIHSDLTEAAEEEAIKVFAGNLEALLMAPPIPYKSVLALDPGIRTGIKTVVLDKDGSFKEHTVLYLRTPEEVEKSGALLRSLLKKHNIGAIGIGNGTGSREAMAFVRQALKDGAKDMLITMVNESGASVYSASDMARAEFPDLDVTVRGAISIGRRIQNPLAELVKIDPRSIGVGQYQHDIDQKKLRESLNRVIEICVNSVGVDLNTASYAILTYVSGLSERVSKEIVQFRKAHGFFRNRESILTVKGIGPKVYEQCAGFLIVREGDNPLDATRVHPETYSVVMKIARDHALKTDQVIGNRELFKKLDTKSYLTESCQLHNLTALIEELSNPLKDPRRSFAGMSYRDDVQTLEDLKEGMIMEGRVTNVTNFGAFIDIGVHNDGLCHVSQLAERFVREPREIVSVGDVVKVKVLTVDRDKRRISLKRLQS